MVCDALELLGIPGIAGLIFALVALVRAEKW